MSTSYKFQGWLGLDPNSANGNMVWQEYEPKPFEETDVDIRITHCGMPLVSAARISTRFALAGLQRIIQSALVTRLSEWPSASGPRWRTSRLAIESEWALNLDLVRTSVATARLAPMGMYRKAMITSVSS
jgi:hypothetical protein